MCRALVIGALLLAASQLTAAQSVTPRFDVASVKLWRPPTTPGPSAGGVAFPPSGSDRFNRRSTVAALIEYAYDVYSHQLSGGPDWMRTERYEVAARAGRDVSQAELRAMVKALLEDRFKLRVRTETREMPVFELRRARSDGRVGPNLQDCSAPDHKVPEKSFAAPRNGSVATADCANGLTYLVTLASRQLEATVVDRTGLTGRWQFHVYYGSEIRVPGIPPGPPNPDLASFETALQEQLGLRLERTRGSVPVVIVESVERATPD